MLLGVLSDTHLRRSTHRLEALLNGPLGAAEAIVHAGDFVHADVVDYLEYVDPRPFYGVAGNMDPADVARRLPSQRVFEVEGVRVGLAHGSGPPVLLARRLAERFDPKPDLLIYGHSHSPAVERLGEMMVVNPGSAFDKRSARACTVALVEVSRDRIGARIVEVGE